VPGPWAARTTSSSATPAEERRPPFCLMSTCRRHDIDPQLYLTHLLTNLGSTPSGEIDQWLPDQWHQRHLATAP
jgi:hypothetical protein